MRNLCRQAFRLGRRVLRFLGDRDDGISGVAAVEFAIVGPMLVLFAIGSIDLGLGIYRNMQVRTAARAGAQYAVTHGFAADAISNAILGATAYGGIGASPAPTEFCGCPSATGIASAACNATCPGGSTAGTYVTAAAQATYRTLLPYPLLPDSFALKAQETVRMQ